MSFTNDISAASIKRLRGRAANPNVTGGIKTVDEAVRATTAFRDVADMMDTLPHYAPKFCISRARTDAEVNAMLRAARAFNAAAERAGQKRRAWVF